MKIRTINFSPDEFIAGVAGMSAVDIGVYWIILSLMYSSGGSIRDDDERIFAIVGNHPNLVRPSIERLINKGKIDRAENGDLSQTRVRRELDAAETRMRQARDAGETGGRPRTKIVKDQGVTKPKPLFSEKPSLPLSRPQPQEGEETRKIIRKISDGLSLNRKPEATREQKRAMWQSKILTYAQTRLTPNAYADFCTAWAEDRPWASKKADEYDAEMRRA